MQHVSTPASGVGGVSQDAPLSRSLADRVAAVNRSLLERFPGSDDAGSLLSSMEGEWSGMIRQPPGAAQKVLRLTRHPDKGINEVVALIDQDPALSQAILKYANSALMAVGGGPGANRVLAPRAAVQRIGSKGVNVVVMAQLVEGQLCKPGGGFDEMAQQIWTHMVRTAPIARDLAPAFRADREQSYSLGLLHDVGKLILFNRMTDMRRELRRDLELPAGFVVDALRELHEPLGGIAFLSWGLGETSARSIANHHRNRPAESRDKYAEIVYLAEAIDIAQQNGASVDLDALWQEGRCGGDWLQVADVLQRYEEQAQNG